MLVNLHTVNVREWVKDPKNVYIGRKKFLRESADGQIKFLLLPDSKWRNPFPIDCINNREVVVRKFERFIRNNSELLKDIHHLKGKNLGCWCYPKLCHGKVIQTLLQQQLQPSEQSVNMLKLISSIIYDEGHVNELTNSSAESIVSKHGEVSTDDEVIIQIKGTDAKTDSQNVGDVISQPSVRDSSSHLIDDLGSSPTSPVDGVKNSSFKQAENVSGAGSSNNSVSLENIIDPQLLTTDISSISENGAGRENGMQNVPVNFPIPVNIDDILSDPNTIITLFKHVFQRLDVAEQELKLSLSCNKTILQENSTLTNRLNEHTSRIEYLEGQIHNVLCSDVTRESDESHNKDQCSEMNTNTNKEDCVSSKFEEKIGKLQSDVAVLVDANAEWQNEIRVLKSRFETSSSTSSESDDENPVNPEGKYSCDQKLRKLYSEIADIQEVCGKNEINIEKESEQVAHLFDMVDNLACEIQRVDTEVIRTNQYNRRPNLVIDGIPDKIPTEYLQNICVDVINKLGFSDFMAYNLSNYEVVGCHRLRKEPHHKTAPVIIRFTNRKVVEFCMENRFGLGKIRLPWKLFFREDLNEANQEIQTECEKLLKAGLITKHFSRNGYVKVYMTGQKPRSKPHKISHFSDLYHLFKDHYEMIEWSNDRR